MVMAPKLEHKENKIRRCTKEAVERSWQGLGMLFQKLDSSQYPRQETSGREWLKETHIWRVWEAQNGYIFKGREQEAVKATQDGQTMH